MDMIGRTIGQSRQRLTVEQKNPHKWWDPSNLRELDREDGEGKVFRCRQKMSPRKRTRRYRNGLLDLQGDIDFLVTGHNPLSQ